MSSELSSPLTEGTRYSYAPNQVQFIAQDYLEHFGSERSRELADTMCDSDRSIAKTIVFTPVLATESSEQLERTLALYTNQRDCAPFTVLLHFNAPMAAGINGITAEFEGIVKQASLVGLDVRSCFSSYDDPTIGEIRKDIWDAGIRLAERDGLFKPGETNDVIGVNQDIDLEAMSPHYIKHIQAHYDEEKSRSNDSIWLSAASTSTSHRYPFDSHPNTALGIFYADLTYRQGGVGYEAGLTVPLAMYMLNGGFNPKDRLRETHAIVNGTSNYNIPLAHAKTSPRRYIDRFPRNGYDELWTADSFGSDDPCRASDISRRDATPEELREHVSHFLGNNVLRVLGYSKHFIQHDIPRGSLDDWVNRSLTRLQRLAINRRALNRVCDAVGDTTLLDQHDEISRARLEIYREMESWLRGIEGFKDT